MRVGQLMSAPVLSVGSDETVHRAAEVMVRRRLAALPVVDDGKLVGIVSEVDVVRARAPRAPVGPTVSVARPASRSPERVADIMTHDVTVARVDDDTADLLRLMARDGVRTVPVVDDGRVVGVVTRRDVLRNIERDDHAIAAEIDDRLRAFARGRNPWEVSVCDGVVTVVGPLADAREADVVTVLATTAPGATDVHVVATTPRDLPLPTDETQPVRP